MLFSAVSCSLEGVAFRPDVNYSIMFIYVILFFKVLNNMKINALFLAFYCVFNSGISIVHVFK